MGLIKDTLSSRPLADELQPTGLVDRMAGFGLALAGVLYLTFDALGGPIRGVFGPIGLSSLIYLPALVAIPSLLANVLTRIADSQTAAMTLAVVAFVVLELIVSVALGRRPEAALFGLYVFMPALVMMALTQRRMQDRIVDFLVPLFFIAILGVVINYFVQFPWADASFEVMGRKMEATREWSAEGRSRIAGFSRASVAAAAQILIGYCAVEYRLRSPVWRGLCWVLGLAAIYITTSKSPFLAMAVLPVTYFVIGRARATGAARRQLLANLLMAFWLLVIFAGPLISMAYGDRIYPNAVGTGRTYSSLADRVLNTWPDAIASIDWRNPVSWLVGRGLGGIGGPAALFEPPGNPGDNMAIYLFVTFGAVSAVFAYLIFRGGQRSIASGGRGRRDFAIIVVLLGIGTAAGVEEVTTNMMLGLAIARQVQRTRVTVAEPGLRSRTRRPRRPEPSGEPATARGL